jgi:hypothetical protein
MTCVAILVGNDNLIEVLDLKNVATGSYINNATVTVTLKDAASVNVTGQSWPVTLNYVAASNGKYRATLVDTLPLVVDETYYATVVADAGDGLKATWANVPVVAQQRIF